MTTDRTPEANLAPPRFSTEELALRRAASRRLAWVLAAVALAIYLGGLFFKR